MAFGGFEIERVARYDESDVERLLGDAGIVRHRGKIEAAIGNARAALALPGGLDALVWSYAPASGRSELRRSPRCRPRPPSRSRCRRS